MYLVELLASYFSVNLYPSLISLCVAISRDCRINNFQYQSDKALPFSFQTPHANVVDFHHVRNGNFIRRHVHMEVYCVPAG